RDRPETGRRLRRRVRLPRPQEGGERAGLHVAERARHRAPHRGLGDRSRLRRRGTPARVPAASVAAGRLLIGPSETAPPMELNPFAWEFHEDPYPTYRWLRDHAPLYRSDAMDFWALSRFQDVMPAFLDWET